MASFMPLGEQLEEAAATESVPTRDKVIKLINEAQMVSKEKKIKCLNQVKELLINNEPDLLDSFMDEVIMFQADQSPEVRKFVITFMEEASKADPALLVRVVPLLAYMMEDQSTVVVKRLLASVIQIYRLALMHIAKMKVVAKDDEEMWQTLQEIKQKVCSKVESENDGVRTITIKFMEFLILTQTKKESNSEAPKSAETDISLDIIPSSHPMLNPAELKEEAGTTMGSLLQITVSPVVSSVNLMTCIISLATIAKQRPSFISTVVQAFELLHANLPPHFATSQISSVRKLLKTQVLGLLRQLSTFECKEQITTLLTDLGCTQAEIAKNTPRESLKRGRSDADSSSASKKMRYSSHATSTASESSVSGKAGPEEDIKPSVAGSALMEAIEITINDLRPLLTPEAVSELVIASMKNVPSTQPSAFGNSYTPIAAAGTEPQVLHLARLLASQMTSAGIGVGAEQKGIKPQQSGPGDSPKLPVDPRKRRREREGDEDGERKRKKIKEEPKDEPPNLEKSMAELAYLGNLLGLPNMMDPAFPMAFSAFFSGGGGGSGGGGDSATIGAGSIKVENTSGFVQSNLVSILTTPGTDDPKRLAKEEEEKKKRKLQATLPQKLKKIRKFDLSSLVRPMSENQRTRMTVASFRRILEAEKVVNRGAGQTRIKLIVNLVTLFGHDFNKTLLDFILEDFKGRFDIATAWLYAEYSIAQGYLPQSGHTPHNYGSCLTQLLLGTKEKLNSRDRLFTKLVLEVPRVTTEALDIIKSYCHDEERAFLGVTTLKELVLRRPHGPQGTEDFLEALLEITVSDIELARIQAMHIAKKLYAKPPGPELALKIERFALDKLQHLLHDHPVFEQQGTEEDMSVALEWTESSVKLYFNLFVALLPLNHKLLTDLAFVFTHTTAAVKKIILRQLDQPVRSIGMDSPELLQLVENCPPGGDALIMRMLHILTDGAAPSLELVNRVREFYHKNSSDVRFLIPVLHGLTKQEVIAALPKFVKLHPNLVKGIFDRLFVSHRGDRGHSISPISPSELLIALHNIDCTSDVIKATNLCFQEKAVYTQEVLAAVLQLLLEQDPIPVMFMRTVLQSLGICPKLVSFVMTILVKLISKQVWKQPKVWQGFVKCCELTKPHSLQVLLKLPAEQLQSILEEKPDIGSLLCNHVQTLPSHQRSFVPRSLLQVIDKYSGTGSKALTPGGKKRRRQSSKGDKNSVSSETENKEKNST